MVPSESISQFTLTCGNSDTLFTNQTRRLRALGEGSPCKLGKGENVTETPDDVMTEVWPANPPVPAPGEFLSLARDRRSSFDGE